MAGTAVAAATCDRVAAAAVAVMVCGGVATAGS